MRKAIRHIAMFCCVLLIIDMSAQTEVHMSSMPRSRIFSGAQMTAISSGISDDQGTGSAINYEVEYVATVDLIYGREQFSDVIGSNWGYEVHYDIFQLEGASEVYIESNSVRIQTFNNNSVYLDRRVHATNGTARVKMTQVAFSFDGWQTTSQSLFDLISQIPEDVRLELRQEAIRYDHLETDILDLTLSENDDIVRAEWPLIPGAEYYELEFEFVSDFVIEDLDLEDPFQDATRIELANNFFEIPGTYPAGTLFARVRPVGRMVRYSVYSIEENVKRVGAWSETESVEVVFQHKENWQATTSFAEQGKYKKVIEYFDDGLKSRQTATNLSTEEIILRTTTHYDFEGRPAVTILPAPDLSNTSLHVHPMFNVLTPDQFDPSPQAMGTSDGAGLYYSSSNPQDKGIHARYIPSADGFPYSHVKYLNDGTGRIESQSGVGAFYQIGSGRETKYFYDDPSDTQLRRLFGSNVGAAKYYKRNAVQDANGQFSVSYIDIAGRTVATALEGHSPGNVVPLVSEETFGIVENLMSNNVIDTTTGLSWVQTSILNTDTPTVYTFDYTLTGLIIEHAMDVCLGCKYELILDIRDPEGMKVVFNGGVDTIEYVSSDECGDTTFVGAPAISFEVTFDMIGTYTISKYLRPISRSIEEWISILSENELLPDTSYFIQLYMSQVDTTECLRTCEQMCRDLALNESPELTGEALDSAIQACVLIECLDTLFHQGSTFECEAMYTQMIQQMMPGGCLDEDWHDQLDGLIFIVEGEQVAGENMLPILTSNLIWENDWADTLVHLHPEYCCYEFCLSMAPSREFDFRFALDNDWSDVESDFSVILNIDPFFNNGGPGTGKKDEMADSLAYYGNSVQACIDAGVTNPVDLVEMIQCVMPDGTEEDWWDFYVGAYLGLKFKLTLQIQPDCGAELPSNCVSVCPGIPEEFAEVETVDDAIVFGNDEMDVLCMDVCEGQATMIANILIETCMDSTASWQELHDLIVEHCSIVCGWQNPLGYLLYEDQEMQSVVDIEQWLFDKGCSEGVFDTIVLVPFDSVYIALSSPQDAGIDVIDTICVGDTIDLFVLQDSLYRLSLDSLLVDSLLMGQEFLMDTGLYYFVGYDPLCNGEILVPSNFEVIGLMPVGVTLGPGTPIGFHPTVTGFSEDHPGCYIFGFYAPEPEGACSEYTEITLYLPGCDHNPQIVLDSMAGCSVSATLSLDSLDCTIDTIIWQVSIDGGSLVSYNSPDTLSGNNLYAFSAEVIYDCCCPSDTIVDTLSCCEADASISASTSNLCLSQNGLNIPRAFQPVGSEIPGAMYLWNFGSGASPATASSYGPHNVSYSTTGTKTIILTVTDGECVGMDTITFVVVACTGNIGGFVIDNFGNGFQGVQLRLYKDIDQDGLPDAGPDDGLGVTQISGSYAFVSKATGHYVIKQMIQPSGYSSLSDLDISPDGDVVPNTNITDDLIPCTLTPGKNDTGNNFVEIADSATISGYVFEDLDSDQQWDSGEGIVNVTVHLYEDYDENGVADDGTPYLTEVTDSDGAYSFYPVTYESYVIIEVQPLYYLNISDLGSSGTGDLNDLTNTNQTDDIIPVEVAPGEHDMNNRFIEECDICEEQTVDLPAIRIIDIITTDGDSIEFSVPFINCMDTTLYDSIAQGIELILESLDPCGNPQVEWIQIDEGDNCFQLIISGSSIWLDFIMIDIIDTFYFDHTNCGEARAPFRSNPGDINAFGKDGSPDQASLLLFPNPAENSFTLEFYHSYEINGSYLVQIYDIQGSIVYFEEFTSGGSIEKLLFDTHAYPPGVYSVVIRDPVGTYSTKLVLIK